MIKIILCYLLIFAVSYSKTLPTHFDLRDVSGLSYVSPVRHQQGGTCWTHGTMAAMESNMLLSGLWWNELGMSDSPDLSEYHLDWWNGFNQYYNQDFGFDPTEGLEVHMGGDYLVASAYFSRGDGAVLHPYAESFETPYSKNDPYYMHFYPRTIEWISISEDLSDIDKIKNVIMEQGAVGTCMYYANEFFDDSTNGSFYQPLEDSNDPNHSIAIVGWNDTISTAAPAPGAWLCKNSWGPSWGAAWNGEGYFWISYYDKHAGKNPEMGCVSFQEVEVMKYDTVYYHDYHGWRDVYDAQEAANFFIGEAPDTLVAVSFFTAADSVHYTIKVFNEREDLINDTAARSQQGYIERKGFHTVDLEEKYLLAADDTFIVYVYLDKGGHPYDRTSVVPVLLEIPSVYFMKVEETVVPSVAAHNESFFKVSNVWLDLQYIDISANFCIKALINKTDPPVKISDNLQETSLGLYPNPSSGKITINLELPRSADANLNIYDLSGRLMKSITHQMYPSGYSQEFFDVSDLSNGLYICILELNGKIVSRQKVVVIR